MLSFASLGIPIISTDIGLVGYPKDFAFRNNNLELYGEQITELLKDSKKIELQSRQARELVEKYFNWDNITEDLIEFYQDIKYSSKDYKEIVADILNSGHLEYELPLPVWLQEKRVKNKSYSKHIKRSAVKFEPYSEANLPTRYGQFKIRVYRNSQSQEEHLVIYKGDISNPNINMRIHSSCVTGDILGSYKCDCGDQLNKSLELFSKTDGLIIYLFQEGRGIGLGSKIKAYKLQDEGYDTYEANVMLGLSPDNREYNMIRDICEDLKINSVTLFTNNPEKLDIFKKLGIRAKRGFLPIDINKVNKKYLETKRDKFDHLLDI